MEQHPADRSLDTVTIWGAGPVGLFAVKSVQVMGAERIIVIETVAERMALEQAVRPSGIVFVPGVHAGSVPVNMATMARKGLTIRSGQTHMKRY